MGLVFSYASHFLSLLCSSLYTARLPPDVHPPKKNIDRCHCQDIHPLQAWLHASWRRFDGQVFVNLNG